VTASLSTYVCGIQNTFADSNPYFEESDGQVGVGILVGVDVGAGVWVGMTVFVGVFGGIIVGVLVGKDVGIDVDVQPQVALTRIKPTIAIRAIVLFFVDMFSSP
jgi:hypothetical protein